MPFVPLTVTKPYVPPPPPQPHSDDMVHMKVALLVAKRSGGFIRFDDIPTGGGKAQGVLCATYPYENNTVFQIIDPLSAMWMGLVKPDDLGLTQTTLAVLKLAMDDLLP